MLEATELPPEVAADGLDTNEPAPDDGDARRLLIALAIWEPIG